MAAENFYSALGLSVARDDGSAYSQAAGSTLANASNTLSDIFNNTNTAFNNGTQAINDFISLFDEKGPLRPALVNADISNDKENLDALEKFAMMKQDNENVRQVNDLFNQFNKNLAEDESYQRTGQTKQALDGLISSEIRKLVGDSSVTNAVTKATSNVSLTEQQILGYLKNPTLLQKELNSENGRFNEADKTLFRNIEKNPDLVNALQIKSEIDFNTEMRANGKLTPLEQNIVSKGMYDYMSNNNHYITNTQRELYGQYGGNTNLADEISMLKQQQERDLYKILGYTKEDISGLNKNQNNEQTQDKKQPKSSSQRSSSQTTVNINNTTNTTNVDNTNTTTPEETTNVDVEDNFTTSDKSNPNYPFKSKDSKDVSDHFSDKVDPNGVINVDNPRNLKLHLLPNGYNPLINTSVSIPNPETANEDTNMPNYINYIKPEARPLFRYWVKMNTSIQGKGLTPKEELKRKIDLMNISNLSPQEQVDLYEKEGANYNSLDEFIRAHHIDVLNSEKYKQAKADYETLEKLDDMFRTHQLTGSQSKFVKDATYATTESKKILSNINEELKQFEGKESLTDKEIKNKHNLEEQKRAIEGIVRETDLTYSLGSFGSANAYVKPGSGKDKYNDVKNTIPGKLLAITYGENHLRLEDNTVIPLDLPDTIIDRNYGLILSDLFKGANPNHQNNIASLNSLTDKKDKSNKDLIEDIKELKTRVNRAVVELKKKATDENNNFNPQKFNRLLVDEFEKSGWFGNSIRDKVTDIQNKLNEKLNGNPIIFDNEGEKFSNVRFDSNINNAMYRMVIAEIESVTKGNISLRELAKINSTDYVNNK